MLKKTILTFAFLIILSFFYGPTDRCAPAAGNAAWTDDYSLLCEGDYEISAYDEVIRRVSEGEGHDWRLMSAIAYHESRFNPSLISRRGARGLMQIMPSVARHFNVPVRRIAEPRTNIWLANKLMSEIDAKLRIPRSVPQRDRMRIVLASYNGGLGHVKDARQLARLHGEDPNSWEVVARYLTLKAHPAYYEQEAVECGRFTGGGQTLAYVDEVMGRYDEYCRMAAR